METEAQLSSKACPMLTSSGSQQLVVQLTARGCWLGVERAVLVLRTQCGHLVKQEMPFNVGGTALRSKLRN